MATKKEVKFKFYPTYNYGGHHDIAIDELKTAIQTQGADVFKLAEVSGVKKQTLDNWFDGKTISPRHATLAAVAGALGMKYVLKKH